MTAPFVIRPPRPSRIVAARITTVRSVSCASAVVLAISVKAATRDRVKGVDFIAVLLTLIDMRIQVAVSRLSLILALFLPLKLQAQFTPREYADRREALLARLPDAVAVIFGAREPAQDYVEFFQNPGMQYLTGIQEPDAALVMVKTAGRTTSTMFVLPRDPAAETWTGKRLGRDGASRTTGLPARDRAQLTSVLDSLA